MDSLIYSLGLALLAGITIPIGAHLAQIENIRPRWLEQELRHGVIAFGGGVLLAATSLVLVPQGAEALPIWAVVASFALGGILFLFVDKWIAGRGGSGSQLMAMLLDFAPEAIAMGAALATGEAIGLLLAALIALQNLPEGFNAFREMTSRGPHSSRRILVSFWAMVLIGPICAYLGHEFLSDDPQTIGVVMLISASGIIYLTFNDIAPQAALKAHWAPPLGAVLGFLVGLVGHMLIV